MTDEAPRRPDPVTGAASESVLVSAVIPTTGRPSLLKAVSSVLDQTLRELEVIVVFDGPLELFNVDLPSDDRVRVVATGSNQGEGPARAAGVEAARGSFVAFLDDDDEWTSAKLEVQLRLAASREAASDHVLVCSRVAIVDAQGAPQLVVPTDLIGNHQTVADYLFRRRRIRWGGAVIHPSTVLCDRAVAIEIPWTNASIHADWDWLLRVTDRPDVDVVMAGEALAIATETPGSASRAANWRGSLEWATANRSRLGDREWADLLLCRTAAFAKAANMRGEAWKLGYRALRYGRPSPRAVAFFVAFQLGPTRILTTTARLPARLARARAWEKLFRAPR